MKPIHLLLAYLLWCLPSFSQLYLQPNSTLYIQQNAGLIVQGDLHSSSDIEGPGKLSLSGAGAQYVNMNGQRVDQLEVDNSQNIFLTGAVCIGRSLDLQNGAVVCNDFTLLLNDAADIHQLTPAGYIQTNGSGTVRKKTAGPLQQYVIPLGDRDRRSPVTLSTQETAAGLINIRLVSTAHPHTPANSSSYLNSYWNISSEGIKEPILATVFFDNPAGITGDATRLRGGYWNGSEWILDASAIHQRGSATITIPEGNGELSALSVNEGQIHKDGVWPNPAAHSTTLFIYSPVWQRSQLILMDAVGRKVFQRAIHLAAGANQFETQLGQLKSGVYTVVIEGQPSRTFRLVKL